MVDVAHKPNFPTIFKRLQQRYPHHAFIAVNGTDPYRILISCILSLRTKDEVSLPATQRLFAAAADIQAMIKLPPATIAKLIYPVGFYQRKAETILDISKTLIQKHQAHVPANLEALLNLKGVGRKTANLVLSLAFDQAAICVDTHVHRISNRLGWVHSHDPETTEMALQKLIPKQYWRAINSLMVNHGQQTCKPRQPQCNECVIAKFCALGLQSTQQQRL